MEHKSDLCQIISDLIDYIADLAPEVRVERLSVIYETEDANLAVYPPLTWDEEKCLDLQEQIGERVAEIVSSTGYLILTGVYSPEQQVFKAKQRRAEAQKVLAEAERILAEASMLGLLNGAAMPSERVPA